VRAGDVLSLQCDSGSEPKRIVRLIGDDDVLASATSMALASKTQKLRLQYRATPVPEAQAARCRAAGVARPCHTLSDVGLDFPDKD
jgi:hypothetical protein